MRTTFPSCLPTLGALLERFTVTLVVRSISDRVGVVEALEREAVPSGTTIAALIRETLDGGD